MQLSEWKELSYLFKPLEVPARTMLLEEGYVSRAMFFIEKGCLRTWINNDGKEITNQFFFEGDTVSSVESFRTNKPSLYSISTIEPCQLQTISQEDFQDALENVPGLKKKLEDRWFRGLFQAQEVLYSFLKSNPQTRCEEL